MLGEQRREARRPPLSAEGVAEDNRAVVAYAVRVGEQRPRRNIVRRERLFQLEARQVAAYRGVERQDAPPGEQRRGEPGEGLRRRGDIKEGVGGDRPLRL